MPHNFLVDIRVNNSKISNTGICKNLSSSIILNMVAPIDGNRTDALGGDSPCHKLSDYIEMSYLNFLSPGRL